MEQFTENTNADPEVGYTASEGGSTPFEMEQSKENRSTDLEVGNTSSEGGSTPAETYVEGESTPREAPEASEKARPWPLLPDALKGSFFIGIRRTGEQRRCSIKADASINELEESATMDKIDATIDLIATDVVGTTVIRPVNPQRSWLWRQWYGTVFEYGLSNAAFYMLISAIISISMFFVSKEDAAHTYIMQGLKALNSVWKYMLTLTIFILTFFLNQSYMLWRKVYNLSRAVQGRTNDIGLLCATHAARDANGEYTAEARKLLLDVAMAVRVLQVFCYATRTRRFRVLHTHRALERMVERGVMTDDMLDAILKLDLSESNRTYVMIEWIMLRCINGMKNGTLVGGYGLEFIILDKGCTLRAQYGTFGDIVDARIPLAYAHFVQVMVDTLLLFAPFALFSEAGPFSIVAVGILTIFFNGLLDLSKVMLDPLDNEDYCDGVIQMNFGVFIREMNGGSERFLKGGEFLPKGWIKNKKT